MTNTQSNEPTLRLLPGVIIVIIQWLVRFVVPIVAPETTPFAVMGGLVGGLAVMVWWGFFSRAPRTERWGAVVLMIVTMLVTSSLLHVSIATGGMGMLFPVFAVPVLSLAFVIWAAVSRRFAEGPRRVLMVATILLSCGVWTLVKTGGFTGEFDHDLAWRWAQTPEDRLLAQAGNVPMALKAVSGAAATAADWPGFLGPERDGTIAGTRIVTDWTASPPVELWRRSIGPGWSSFAVHGDLMYTQEQRGEDEAVACYEVTTGEPVWRHLDATRFWESNAGAGPRGTPTLSDGRVYTFGATGILNALDAADGTVVWSRNAATDTGAKLPIWGFSSSPLVVDDLVVVAASGALVAYDRATGESRWSGPVGDEGYSSPHLLSIGGVEQILQLSGAGVASVTPADGSLLWEHEWSGYPIVQPVLTADGDVLISAGQGKGMRRLAVTGSEGWRVDERWSSNGLKPYYSDFVVHDGHAFGFDGSHLACIDVEDGKRTWKGGRYGAGQLILLVDQDLLLLLSEKGELALVAADPDQFREIARFPAIEGKTWNHPVLVDDVLLVRNAEEMAAFRLSLAAG
jgi:outer membrane protein assembly factor BamB